LTPLNKYKTLLFKRLAPLLLHLLQEGPAIISPWPVGLVWWSRQIRFFIPGTAGTRKEKTKTQRPQRAAHYIDVVDRLLTPLLCARQLCLLPHESHRIERSCRPSFIAKNNLSCLSFSPPAPLHPFQGLSTTSFSRRPLLIHRPYSQPCSITPFILPLLNLRNGRIRHFKNRD